MGTTNEIRMAGGWLRKALLCAALMAGGTAAGGESAPVAPGALTAANRPERLGLRIGVRQMTIRSRDEISLVCAVENVSGALLQVPVRQDCEHTATTQDRAADGRKAEVTRTVTRTLGGDRWDVLVIYQAGEERVGLVVELVAPSELLQPLAAGETRLVELRLPGGGKFTPEFCATMDEIRLSYRPNPAPTAPDKGYEGQPELWTLTVDGEALRKMLCGGASGRPHDRTGR